MDDVIDFKIHLGSISRVMADREKTDVKTKIQKFEYFKNKQRFLKELKTFFIVFEGLSYNEKQKIDSK